jgi:hypothetical protein
LAFFASWLSSASRTGPALVSDQDPRRPATAGGCRLLCSGSTAAVTHLLHTLPASQSNMPGPGSVHMADADDIIEILSSEEGGGSDEEAGSMSEGGSEEYNYSTDDDASGDLGEEDPRPMSVSEKKLPYRIIDSEALKQVQVRPPRARAPGRDRGSRRCWLGCAAAPASALCCCSWCSPRHTTGAPTTWPQCCACRVRQSQTWPASGTARSLSPRPC